MESFWHEDEREKSGILRKGWVQNTTVEQKKVEKSDTMNKFPLIVSNSHPGALDIVSDDAVYSCFLEKGKKGNHMPGAGPQSLA